MRKRPLLGPYSRPMSRVLRWSYGGGRFLMSEVPLQAPPRVWHPPRPTNGGLFRKGRGLDSVGSRVPGPTGLQLAEIWPSRLSSAQVGLFGCHCLNELLLPALRIEDLEVHADILQHILTLSYRHSLGVHCCLVPAYAAEQSAHLSRGLLEPSACLEREREEGSRSAWVVTTQSKNNHFTIGTSGSEVGSYLRHIDSCITQL